MPSLSPDELAAIAKIDLEVQPVSNRRETLLGVFLSFGITAIFAVALRLYARFKHEKGFGWDDLLVVCSLASVSTGAIFLCMASYAGLGEHFFLLSPEGGRTFLFRFYVANATYSLSTALLKLSLLCQYLRLFDQRRIRLYIWTLLGICLVWGFVTSFMSFFPCFPVKGYWDRSLVNANCYAYGSAEEQPFYNAYVSHGVLNMILDFAVLVLPAPLVFRKAMTTREQAAAAALGSLGLFVIATCAWKLAEIIKHRAGFEPYHDPSWWSALVVILAALEVNIGIVAVSCPVFWPMIEEHVFGIVVHQEVQITHERSSRFHSLGDSDDKSEHGSEAALAYESDSKKKTYYTEELALEPMGLGQTDTTIQGRRRSHVSWPDTTL